MSARDNPSETDASVLDAATAVGLVLVGLMTLYAMGGYVNGVIQSQMELLANLIERVCEVYDLLLEVRDLAWRILTVLYSSRAAAYKFVKHIREPRNEKRKKEIREPTTTTSQNHEVVPSAKPEISSIK